MKYHWQMMFFTKYWCSSFLAGEYNVYNNCLTYYFYPGPHYTSPISSVMYMSSVYSCRSSVINMCRCILAVHPWYICVVFSRSSVIHTVCVVCIITVHLLYIRVLCILAVHLLYILYVQCVFSPFICNRYVQCVLFICYTYRAVTSAATTSARY